MTIRVTTFHYSRGKPMKTRDLAHIALFTAMTAALGLLPPLMLPLLGVPITAQSMGPMLAGAILGARRGGLASALFILLVALGFPVLSGGRGGFGILFGPGGGFLLAYPVAALRARRPPTGLHSRVGVHSGGRHSAALRGGHSMDRRRRRNIADEGRRGFGVVRTWRSRQSSGGRVGRGDGTAGGDPPGGHGRLSSRQGGEIARGSIDGWRSPSGWSTCMFLSRASPVALRRRSFM